MKLFDRPKAPPAPVLATSRDPVRTFVAGDAWSTWPDTWQTGVAAMLHIPAPGAWTAPEGLGHVVANLATMLKAMRGRIDQTKQRGQFLAGTLALARRGTPVPDYTLRALGVMPPVAGQPLP